MEHLLKIIGKPDNLPIILMLLLTIYYTWLAMSKARKNDRQDISEEAKQADKVQVWPYLVKVEFLAALFVMVVLTFWSFLLNAPLEEPANPALTPNPSKAPWYFLGLQEILVYFDPWIAGVVVPTLIIMGLCAIPYIQRTKVCDPHILFRVLVLVGCVDCVGNIFPRTWLEFILAMGILGYASCCCVDKY
jgi:quinol-cytochrome oxidoreductase complex cytochrome b subunit